MTREALIDIIRAELQRQKSEGKLSLVISETPDNFTVIGVIDIHKLAEAIKGDR